MAQLVCLVMVSASFGTPLLVLLQKNATVHTNWK
nr:MAG TPA: hypothetical protein [Caudoviricetes sp.]